MKVFFFLLSLTAALGAANPASADEMQLNWSLQLPIDRNGIPPGMALQRLITLTNDRDATVNALSLLLDQQIQGMYISSAQNIEEGKALLLQEIESKDGAVLLESSGRKAIILLGKLDHASQQGRFKVRYLTNALSMAYSSCDFLLQKNESGWFIQNVYTNEAVSAIRIVTWSLGITTIQGICPK